MVLFRILKYMRHKLLNLLNCDKLLSLGTNDSAKIGLMLTNSAHIS